MEVGDVRPFNHLRADDKALALKPLEEAAEVVEAWKRWRDSRGGPPSTWYRERRALVDEIADCIQACLDPGWLKDDPEGRSNFWGVPIRACDWRLAGWSYFRDPDVRYWMPVPEAPNE